MGISKGLLTGFSTELVYQARGKSSDQRCLHKNGKTQLALNVLFPTKITKHEFILLVGPPIRQWTITHAHFLMMSSVTRQERQSSENCSN